MENNLIKQLFEQRFGHKIEGNYLHHFFAPGRINLIGEHIDYNGGHVLPMAIELGINAYLYPRNDKVINIQSLQHKGILHINLSKKNFDKRDLFWANYPLGVIQYFFENNKNNKNTDYEKGFDLLIDSNLPMASGLSSSAALEVLIAFIWQWFMEKKRNFTAENLIQLALISQKVENNFIGVQCGIMDQFAVAMGQKSKAILLNCNTLAYRYCNFTLSPDHVILILNSNKKRALADSKYNQRKQDCEVALAILQAQNPNLKNHCQANKQDLKALEKQPILHKRARHTITEQLRVMSAFQALEQSDMPTFGRLMNESHESLQYDYEVSGFELDVLVQAAQQLAGCLGARMTGAGFGGCAIALVEKKEIESFKQKIKQHYDKKTGLSLTIYESKASRGVHYLGQI